MNGPQMLRAVTLGLGLVGPLTAVAQSSPKTVNNDPIQTFYLKNALPDTNDAQEVLTALRLILEPSAKLYLDSKQTAIVARTTPENMVLIQKIIDDLDRPGHTGDAASHKSFRLTYTVSESEDGKRVGVQHFSMVIVEGGRTMLKNGSSVPVPSGSISLAYVDVGLNFDSSLDPSVNGERLRSKIEQASMATGGTQASQLPIKRQVSLELTSYLIPGKPLVVGALDVPGSTRHLEVEALLEPLR